MKQILYFVVKELLQFHRDRRLLGVVIIAPIIQLILLGYAANMDVKVIDIAILDSDNSHTSREFVQSLLASGYFQLHSYVDNYVQLNELINRGDVLVGLVFPNDFERKIYRGENPKLQVILDGSNGNKSSIVFGYLLNLSTGFSKRLMLEKVNIFLKQKVNFKGIDPQIRVWYNPEMVTRRFLLPGILALLLLIITVPLTAMAIVKEKEAGTLEQLIITPLKPYQIIAGKLIPYVLVGFIDFLLVVSVMQFWFGIMIRGNFLLLLLASALFVISNLGIGLYISTSAKSQQQAMILSVFGVIVPMIYLSGFVFPIENMPKVIQYITFLIPLKYYLVILRGVVLKGVGIAELWDQILILSAYGLLLFFLSSTRFKNILH